MAISRICGTGFVLLLLFGRLTWAEPQSGLHLPSICPVNSIESSIFGFLDSSICHLYGDESVDVFGDVIEGDEAALLKALYMVHKKTHDYIAVLLYASWCPFSGVFRPSFSILASLYPSIPHFAIEEQVIRPSMLSKYGVHGFPTLFLLNSTMRVRYHGSRTPNSLISFYEDVTGLKTKSVDGTSIDRVGPLSDLEKDVNTEQESCPFSWARSPENLLQQETYLALATSFVLLRLLCIIFPTLRKCAQFTWTRCILNVRLRSLLEHPVAYLNRAIQLFSSLMEPCKRSNLQEGAINAKAKAWASKSLASVSFGDGSTSRAAPVS